MTHTSTEQAEALRLAECLEKHVWQATPLRLSKVVELSADELRRLHARVQELEAENAHLKDAAWIAIDALEASHAQRVPLALYQRDTIKANAWHETRDAGYWDVDAIIDGTERAHGITQEKQG